MKWTIKVLFTPSCWLQLGKYNHFLDKKLNRLLEIQDFEKITQYYATIGTIKLWIENHPYGSFVIASNKSIRPKRSTILKAYEKLQLDILMNNNV